MYFVRVVIFGLRIILLVFFLTINGGCVTWTTCRMYGQSLKKIRTKSVVTILMTKITRIDYASFLNYVAFLNYILIFIFNKMNTVTAVFLTITFLTYD